MTLLHAPRRALRLTMAVALATLCTTAAFAQTDAVTAAINAGVLLFEKSEYAAARELLRAYVDTPKGGITFVRAGIALGNADAGDFAVISELAGHGSVTALRIKGDMLRAGTGIAADPTGAEAAYRAAASGGDEASDFRLATLLLSQNRAPEALEIYATLLPAHPEIEARYTALSITTGTVTDPDQVAALLARLDSLAATDAFAARAAVSIYENGIGVSPDPARAATYARQAVSLGATDMGWTLARNCETCSALEVVDALKSATTLGRPADVARSLQRPLAYGFYADAFTVVARFAPDDRRALIDGVVAQFGAMSNPVVGLTQALLKSQDAFPGTVDGQFGPQTAAALRTYAAANGITFTEFTASLVEALFSAQN